MSVVTSIGGPSKFDLLSVRVCVCVCVCVCVSRSFVSKSLGPMNCSPPGSSVHGIL